MSRALLAHPKSVSPRKFHRWIMLACQGTCSSKIFKLLLSTRKVRRKYVKFFLLRVLIWSLTMIIPERQTDSKKRKKSHRIISFYEYWCKDLKWNAANRLHRTLKYSTQQWGLTQECKWTTLLSCLSLTEIETWNSFFWSLLFLNLLYWIPVFSSLNDVLNRFSNFLNNWC